MCIQISMRGQLRMTTNSFHYSNPVGNTDPDNWIFLDARTGADDARNRILQDDDNNIDNDSSNDDNSEGLEHHIANGMDHDSDIESNERSVVSSEDEYMEEFDDTY